MHRQLLAVPGRCRRRIGHTTYSTAFGDACATATTVVIVAFILTTLVLVPAVVIVSLFELDRITPLVYIWMVIALLIALLSAAVTFVLSGVVRLY